MTTNNVLRRAGLGFVGLASTVLLAVGCSSSSNGNPSGGFPGGNNQSSSQGGGQVNGGSSAPGGKAVASDFCKDFNSTSHLSASDFASASRAQKVVAVWDRLANEAPGPIKSDVQKIDDFLKTVESGQVDMSQIQSKIQQLTQTYVRIGRYLRAHC